jgi:chromosome partitioning protein
MLTLAVASQKGGVGKTTVALNLAYALARRGWRVLLVDTDVQGSIGYSLQGEASRRSGLVDFLRGDKSFEELILPTRFPSFHVLPAGAASATDVARWSELLAGSPGLAGVQEASAERDLLVVDTSSGLQGDTLEVLLRADFVLVPLQAEPLALRSLQRVLDALVDARTRAPQLRLAGFVLTMISTRHEVSLSVAQESWRLLPGDRVLETTVPRHEAFLEASAKGVPLGLLSHRPPPVAAVFDQLAAELEPRLGLVEEQPGEPIPLLA